jgi:drug/metabolite transporter (DMT)-like permease
MAILTILKMALAGLFFALYMKQLKVKDSTSKICGLAYAFCGWISWYLWFNVLALTIFPTIISLICTTEAIQCIGSTPTAILGVLEPVTAVFFGVLVFDEVMTPRIVIGLILVIVSVTLVVAGGHTGKLLLRLRKMFPVKVNKTTGQQDDK